MKKHLLLLIACLATSASAFSETLFYDNWCSSETCVDCFGFDSMLTMGVGGGYREDQLKWDLLPALKGTQVNEKWKKIQMGIVETDVKFLACEHYLFQVDFDYGWFSRRGHQTVDTFSLATNTLLSSLKSRTSGRAYNLSGAIGYQFNLWNYRFSLAPLVGYSYHFQKFKNNGYVNELVPADETFAGVHNRHTNRWRGPFVGFTTAFQISCDWQIYFSYEHHWARYRSKVQENFIVSDFPAHQKANNVRGNEFILGTNYQFCNDWQFSIKLDYKNFSSSKGKQENEEIISSNLRDLNWKSLSATLGVAYIF